MTQEQLETENARLREQIDRLRAMAPRPEDLGCEALRWRQIKALDQAAELARALG